MNYKNSIFIDSKVLFILFLVTIIVVSITVFVTGIDIKRSIYFNTFITISILSFCFFAFLFISLYFGIRIKETVGNLSKQVQIFNVGSPTIDLDFPDFADDFESGVAAIILWLGATISIILLFFFFETILWGGIVIISAGLYWIFYRATKFVFRKNIMCKNNLLKSLSQSFLYTFMYSSWIYGCVFVVYYFKN